ncbi:MAG: hypothetical protein ACP5OA_03830 [Candidatus Woesearchaeota archaeon]
MSLKSEILNVIDCMNKGRNYLQQSTDRFIADCKYIFNYAVDSVGRTDAFYSDSSSNSMHNYRYKNNDNTFGKRDMSNDTYGRRYNANTDSDTLEAVVLGKVPDPEKLSQIIDIKNKYFWKNNTQLQDILKTEADISIPDISSLIKDAMVLKINNPKYSSIARINYDSRIASQDMKNEFIRAYTSSEKTLKEISKDFEKKYGMHISVSTISRNARNYLGAQGLEFKNRREAKRYYENISTAK